VPLFQANEGLLEAVGVPEGLRSLVTFLLIMAVAFAPFLLVVRVAVGRRWISRSTAAFWVFVSPWLFGFLIFTLGPMVYSLALSFFQWDLLSDPVFTGIGNYEKAFTDPLLTQAMKVTLIYAFVSVPLSVILSLLVALLMNVKVRGSYFFRTVWYLPSLVTGVAQTILFLWVFNPRYGLLNGLLGVFGIQGPAWFNSEVWALPAVILMSLWTVGGNMVIYLAGLQDVPQELYEAVELDGAGRWRRFWHITLPQISPIIFFNVVTGLIGAMQTFTQGYVVTQAHGGPNNSLLFYVLYLYKNAFQFFQMGYASALAWILLVMILLLTLLVFRGSAFWVFYESSRPTTEKRAARVN
jgi:multiple sugar transport system permease protein